MAKQTTFISRKPLLMTLCLAFFALPAACDKPQTDKTVESAPPQTAATEETVNGSSSDTTTSTTKTAPIVDIAVNADETLLATAQGKRVIIWELETGKEKYELEIPQEHLSSNKKNSRDVLVENNGNIYAVIFDPKNRWIIVAGSSNYIYFFNTSTMKLDSKIKTENTMTIALCSSDDAETLASIGTKGVAIFHYANKEFYFKTTGEYPPNDCLFGESGLIVSGSDGYLHLYKNNGEVIAKEKMLDDTVPSKMEHGSNNKFSVARYKKDMAILSFGKTKPLKIEGSVNSVGVKGDYARSAGWSSDGRELCSGGQSSNESGKYFIYCWDISTKGMKQLGGFDSHIQKIKIMKNGRIIVATAKPAWYIITPQGVIMQEHLL